MKEWIEMTDLVRQLRLAGEDHWKENIYDLAADEIERLRAALEEIANYPGASNDDAEPCREIARKALMG